MLCKTFSKISIHQGVAAGICCRGEAQSAEPIAGQRTQLHSGAAYKHNAKSHILTKALSAHGFMVGGGERRESEKAPQKKWHHR